MSATLSTKALALLFSLLMVTSMGVASIAVGANTAQAQTGENVLYRVNGHDTTVQSTDDGPDWTPPGSTSGVTVSGNPSTYNTGDSITLDGTVPPGTPSDVFQSELYGDQQWDFEVTSGQAYEVRLYFAETYAESPDQRSFDVAVEGETVLNDYDIYADVGHDVGTMKSVTVTPSDGTIDVDLTTEIDNAKISAIEIVQSEPEPDTLDGPSSVDFGSVIVGDTETKTVTVTNLGDDGDSDITLEGLSVSGDDAFSAGAPSQTTLAPGESAGIPLTFSPSSADSLSASLDISHSGSNSPLTVNLSGEGASSVDPSFEKSTLEGFSAGNPTAIEFGPDGRVYVSTQGGMVYALNVTRTGDNSYEVTNEVAIDVIQDIPNHDDLGNIDSSENNRQITGLTVGGTASQPVVYVSSSDPEIDVGQDDDDTDTNSGAISRLTVTPGSDDTLQTSDVEHDVMVLGLPRSEENHATNGLDLSPDGDTLYVAQGGHTNKGAPSDNFGHTPEYALSAAILEIDLAQIENNYQEKSLQTHKSEYPDLDYLYALPTIQGGDLPFGGNDGINQAKLVEGGPVQIYSPGYRNPYDLVLAESGQLFVSDHGPNGGWGGQPADADGNIVADASDVTNHPNEDGSYTTSDQLIAPDEGDYAGHAAPIRANPTQADIYYANGTMRFDVTGSNSPVPSSMVDSRQADYIPPTSGSPDPGAPAGSANTMEFGNGDKVLFGPTGGMAQYTASNFGGAMEGDLLQVELYGSIKRVELSADGETVTNVETIANTDGPLGIAAQDDDEVFPGTVWIANHGGNDVTVFEPVDYGDGDAGEQCDPDTLDPSGDADGDGYTNGDELAVGTDPCSSASTPADFDDDGNPNELDPDDDNDGLDDTEDPFAVDPDNGLDTTLPVQHDLSELSLFGENGQGWTGLMTNGEDYQALYDQTQMTVGGAAEVLTVENVPQGDAYSTTNTQQYAFQFGVDPPDEPFTVETTVASFPENPEDYQSAGLFIGPGDQSNYVKLVAAANGGDGGVEFAKEVDDSFDGQMTDESAVTGNDVTLRMTVDPTTDPAPDNGVDEVAVTAEYEVDGTTTEVGTVAMPASWLDTSDGVAPAVGIISTSNGATSTFDATWTNIGVEYVTPPENQPPVADAGADQAVDEGQQVTLDASESNDSDGDSLSYSWTQTAGSSVDLSGADTATPTFTAPDVDADETLAFEVTVSDGTDSATDTVNVTVENTEATQPTDGEIVYRVNAGGSELAAIEDGPAWSTDTLNDPSQFTNADESGSDTYSTDDAITLDDSVPSSAPSSLFQTERWDPNATTGSSGDAPEMQWHFPAQSDQTYEVRLYFAEIYLEEGATLESEGPREFDVVLEGQTVLDDYNLHNQYGHDVGVMESFEVTPSDDDINVTFLHEAENPKISAIEIVAVDEQPADEMTVEEAVASAGDGDDSTISLQEIQTAINWWSNGAEVPNTGGETISLSEVQQLISLWSNGETVSDGGDDTAPTIDAISDQTVTEGDSATVPVNADDPDGDAVSLSVSGPDFVSLSNGEITIAPQSGDATDSPYTVTVQADDGTDQTTESFQLTVEESGAAVGSAQIGITPDSGTEASTYGGSSFTVENTGDQQIASVTFDLSSSAMPDMVFDPDGTAGDQAAKGLVIDSESGDGVGVVSTADDDVFSQPHNGVNGSDGYEVLTVEFTDFDPGESVSFSADNDPTSIKNSTISSQEAGPVSGLELARSTVSVEYDGGDVQEAHLFGDGSAGGAQATLDKSIAQAPDIGVQNVDLVDGALRDHHSAATVSEANQTVTITGEPDETVTLLHAEAELELDNVPEYDGTPGYDVEAYEANKVENVDYQTVTLDSNGEAEVPVTLLNTTAVGGYNYFVATHGEPGTDTGLDSNVVVLKYEASAGDDEPADGETAFAVNAGGDAYTAADGTEFQADTNFTGGETFTTGQFGTPSNPEIANTEDDELYYTERYGDFSYDVPLKNGTYEVTLHFVELYQGVANDGGEGDRLFNTSVEGEQVLSTYDIYAEAGGAHAAVTETVTVEVTDGELNVEFSSIEDNAKVSAIEVEPAEPADGGGDDTAVAAADISVTPDSGIDTSTYSSGSFEIENTGDEQITSVTFDASESLLPDAVFDPDGTAGDATAKQLSVDSQTGDGVGVVSTADDDVFSQPHNGEDNAEGYDVMTVEFTDFDPGESVSMSIDMDPTTIKDASTTGGAGSISGLEIAGSTTSVEYADGSTQTTDLFGDGSDGGAQATADADVPDAPTLGVEGVSLQSTDFAGHEAASVDDSSQALSLSGPADGTVELIHVEASEPPTDGYDVEAFEADNAQSVSYQTVTLDSNGQATVPVSLAESNLNYFLAAVEDGDGDTGQASNTIILDYESSAASTQEVLHRVNAGEGTTVSATDDGPDWTGVVDTSSPYLASVGSSDAVGNTCIGEITSTTPNVPSSTPDGVWNCERYGEMTWEFDVDSGQQVEVRLYVGNSYSETSEPGNRQFNVSIEGQQVLTQYDPVADVGHETGTVKNFTVTDDGDGTIAVAFEEGAAENPEIRAIEILESSDSSSQ
ncbi:malectin domain-containing carbohydrate-binding protein [Halobellus marinus]|uniref:malectin domain-containing carbohydrate-binding protein n=1 Tax=Halobellus TaxID=1073986 RepID=UPI0028AC6422|nr:malectin domain-containing carbohydrate-binding protein [Halobellus sp. DFY28]